MSQPPGRRSGDRTARRRLALAAMTLLGCLIGIAMLAPATTAAQPRIYALQVRGVISELVADHVLRVIEKAEGDGAAALVLQIDSPGGVDTATRRITQAILAARVPVIVYVGPEPDAQALSGAMFITLSGHVAAMASGSAIGAALPEGLADRASPQERAARNAQGIQAAATIADVRGRNVDATVALVQEERIVRSAEAIDSGIIDRVSPDLPALLSQIDGMEVRTGGGPVTIMTKNSRVVWIHMTWRERGLQAITDPNVAYLLFSAGVLLLIVELYGLGRLWAGIPGVLALIAAFIALGNLPVSWIGLGLLILGAVLFIAELYTPPIGLVGAAGVVSYLVGSLTLYTPVKQASPFAPDVSVNPWVILGTIVFLSGALLLFVRSMYRRRRELLVADALSLIGHAGVVVETLAPRGVVRVLGQEWSATSGGDSVDEGTEVLIQGVESGMLRVEPVSVNLPQSERADRSSNGMSAPR